MMQESEQRKVVLASRRIIVEVADDSYNLSVEEFIEVSLKLKAKNLPCSKTKIKDTLRMYKKTKLASQGDPDAQAYLKGLSLNHNTHWFAIPYECLCSDGLGRYDKIEEAMKDGSKVEGVSPEKYKPVERRKVEGSVKLRDVMDSSPIEEAHGLIENLGNAVAKIIGDILKAHGADRAELINCIDELSEVNNIGKINEDLRSDLRQKEKEIKAANETIARQKKELEDVSQVHNIAEKRIKELEGWLGRLRKQLDGLRKTKPKKKVRKKKKPA